MTIGIIFPHQLFELKYIPFKCNDFYIIEESLFFHDRERITTFNPLKLVYQRQIMKNYESYLKKNKKNVKYFECVNVSKILNKDDKYYMMDPSDHLLMSRLNKFNIEMYDTPYFLLNDNDMEEYMKPRMKKKLIFYHFYTWCRKRFNILMDGDKPIGGKFSFDSENRKSMKGSFKSFTDSNKIKYVDNKFSKGDSKAINYVKKKFGVETDYSALSLHPKTHKEAKDCFKNFVKTRLTYFGDYEDAITDHPHMFHSTISSALNAGLITPAELLIKKGPIASVEGFVRQLFWREYTNMLYKYRYNDMIGNYFNNTKRIDDKFYPGGETGITPIDDTVNEAFKLGYIHHIKRLMVMCNYFNLCRIHPDDVYKWFMEFSLDSYDWVMIFNVYSMGLYADGGKLTSKVYISSSKYILRMSTYKKDTWCDVWDTLYYYFIGTNKNKIKGRGIMYVQQWEKLDKKTQADILKRGKSLT